MVKSVRAVIFAFVIATICMLSVTLALATEESAYAATEGVYELSEFTQVGGEHYSNGIDENNLIEYKVMVREDAYENLIRVEYDVVRLGSIADTVTVDDSNNVELSSGQIKVSENNVVAKEEIQKQQNSSKYAFTVKTDINCAFVFTVYYLDAEGDETPCYGSSYGTNGTERTNILYCKKIDSSAPTAYFDDVTYDSGYWVVDVVIKGNKNEDKASADSGLKAFSVIKKDPVSGAEETIDEVKDIGATQYRYKLRVTKAKAAYYLDIVDFANNGTTSKILEFFDYTYDKGFETAVSNSLNKIKADETISDKLVESFTKAYEEYSFVIQTTTDDEEINKKKQSCYGYMERIAAFEKMKEEGLTDLTVKNYNTEYFGGEITFSDSSAFPIKYGDGAVATISVSFLSENSVDKSAEMSVAEIRKADALYAVTIATETEGVALQEAIDGVAELRIPAEFDKNDVAFVMKSAGEKTEYAVCDYVVGNGYTLVYIPYTSGTVNIFVGISDSLNWLWSLTAIPVIAAAVAVPIIIKNKKKKIKND